MLEVLRKENKYSISMVGFGRIQSVLDGVMERDAHDTGSRGYEVRSLYFDALWDSDLLDVLAGLLSKQKVRLRCYSTSDRELKLEYKCKTGTDSNKKSLTVSRAEAESMISGRYDFLMGMGSPVAAELYGRLKSMVYCPRVVVRYQRIAYLAPANDVRVTFDYDVCASFDPWALFDDNAVFEPVSMPGSGVLEIKYNSFLPDYLRSALAAVDVLPVSNSKYAQARLLL